MRTQQRACVSGEAGSELDTLTTVANPDWRPGTSPSVIRPG
jgi:hypothetical protein